MKSSALRLRMMIPYFLYSSDKGSLYAISLESGKVLTSVSGCNPYYLIKERQVGYLFRRGTEEKTIFLSNIFCPFKFIRPVPYSRETIAAVFCSSDTVLVVSSDSNVTFWQTNEEREDITFISRSSLRSCDLHVAHVKNCALSPDGKLIAVHRGTKLLLYSFTESKSVEFLYTVFQAECEDVVVYSKFSNDSSLLLFCIQSCFHSPRCYVWDVQGKFESCNFESTGVLVIDCCCLSSLKQEVILCGEYLIEIWKYGEPSCRVLTRLGVEKSYQSVKFNQCAVSIDGQLLICSIANTILVYSLNAPQVNSSKQVLRGHLGRIEFFQILKGNRYLISYGVDGLVFLWDISGSKAVAFSTIAQGQENIVSMAVSPEENKAVCFFCSGRVCVIKLWNLGSVASVDYLTGPERSKVKTGDRREQAPNQFASTATISTSAVEHDTSESFSSFDVEEDDYFLEDLDESSESD